MSKVIFNGGLIEESEAQISITDKGYFFDFAVYSSIKVVQGKVFFPEYHVVRLFESAKLIDLQHKFKTEYVVSWLWKLVEVNQTKDALLRVILIGDPNNTNKEKLFIFTISGLTFYPDKLYKHGAKVITYKGERRIPNSKTKDLLLSFLAYREAKKRGAIDALLVDQEGIIREGTRSNLFAIKDGVIFSSPPEKVLGGITKKILVEAVTGKFKIKTDNISLKNLGDYDEFFISSSSFNVMPIKQINDLVIDNNFLITREVEKLFKQHCNDIVFHAQGNPK